MSDVLVAVGGDVVRLFGIVVYSMDGFWPLTGGLIGVKVGIIVVVVIGVWD